jgi:hypothetical protein
VPETPVPTGLNSLLTKLPVQLEIIQTKAPAMKTIKNVVPLAVAVALFAALNVQACFDPSVGRWASRDPIEESGGINLYGFVQNDPVNGEDILGQEKFDIWASAYIPYTTFIFPDPPFHWFATWYGDGRTAPTEFGSARGWNHVVIDTDPSQTLVIDNSTGAGVSRVDYWGGSKSASDTPPSKASISKSGCTTTVSMDATLTNPLTPSWATPSLHYDYNLNFDIKAGVLTVTGHTKWFPSYDLIVNGSTVHFGDARGGNPGLLILPVEPITTKTLQIMKYCCGK